MSKRPPQGDSHQMEHSQKRKKPNKVTGSGFVVENITTARQLQSLLGDFSSPEGLNNGLQQFRSFLRRCSNSDDASEDDVKQNLKVLKEWLETQSKSTNDSNEGEDHGNAFIGILQVWSYASQNNSLLVLSAAVASLALLVRICSHNEELKTCGVVLCKAILQPAYLKIVYRNLVSSKDHVTSPTLRMLTEINKFDYGSLCRLLHSAFDFTTKDITKNLEVRGGKGDAAIATDDLHRPSIRTTFMRFILSFFQHGSSSVKNEMLGHRVWVSAMFKYLRIDSPLVVNDFLETMDKKVLADKDIPRATKTNVFNEWILSHIVALYSRTDTINVTRLGKDEARTIAEASHAFLLKTCTTPGNGVCFADSGWYPLRAGDNDYKRRGTPKVYNRILSSLILNIRPFADTLQQDLLLEIFKVCSELVADFFLNNSSFSFDPKLTSTWIGYCAFLSSVVQLPVPNNFGMSELSATPPPTNVVIENVVPKPLSKATLTKCLLHENSLIKFFVTRLLVFSFQKLRKVLCAIDNASASMVDPSSNWTKTRLDLVEEFCKRVPDMAVVVGLLKTSTKGRGQAQGKLQKEVASRLLAGYYELMPEVALAAKFDITATLGSFLVDEDIIEKNKGLQVLEMGHLLRVAKDAADTKWWSKSASMPFSLFVSILKVCCGRGPSLPLGQIRILLHSFVAPSRLFQNETVVSPLEALLESLSSIQDPSAIDVTLSFLDESVGRAIHGTFKYIDDYAELALDISKTTGLTETLPAVSPFTMAVVEQWKFLMQSKSASITKHATAIWLARFMESSAILGENKYVLAALCERLAASCQESGHRAGKAVFKILKHQLEDEKHVKLGNNDTDVIISGFETLETDNLSSCVKWPRALFNGIGHLDIDNVELVTKSIKERKIEVSLFDIAVAQKAVLCVLQSREISCEDSCLALPKLMDLLEAILLHLREDAGDPDTWGKAKRMLTSDSEWAKSLLGLAWKVDEFPRYVYFSKRYSDILAANFSYYEPVLNPICARAKSSLDDMGHYFEDNPEDAHRSEVLSVYKNIIFRHLSSNDTLDIVRSIVLAKDDLNELQFDVLAQLLHRLTWRKEYLPIKDLEKLLLTADAPKTLCDALTEYLISAPKHEVESLDAQLYKLDFEAELHEWTVLLDCALIRQIESVRVIALTSLDKTLQHGKNIPHLVKYLSALLEGFSMTRKDEHMYQWKESVDAEAKRAMERLFSAAQGSMFDGPLDAPQLGLLQRAISLLTSVDRKRILKQITSDNQRSSLTPKITTLLDTLIREMNLVEAEPAELRSWLLMAFDHLTRRFAEDKRVSEKTVNLSKQLGRLLNRGKISLGTSVPRATLNAVLEAGLQKHIHIPEVVYFAAVIVSQLTAKYLDLAKLLQLILGHPQNPLLLRDNYFSTQEISHHTAYLIYRLFSLARSPQSNVTTLDGVLNLYRGSNDIIDTAFLDIIKDIEAHLARSCADRITSWSVVENAGGSPLISRTRGRLAIAIDAKTLTMSIFQSLPNRALAPRVELEGLNSFMDVAKNEDQHFSKTYDLEFILPALAYCLFSGGQVMDVQAIIGRNCLGFAIMGLCSDRANARNMAISFISSVVAKLEDSAYREKTEILRLLCALLASITAKAAEGGYRGLKKPIPTVVGVFYAQCVQVLSNPGHFLYEKVNELLLRRPLLDLHDLPYMLQISMLTVGDEYQKEISWVLNVLAAGLKTEDDLNIYRKRNIFGSCLNLYISSYCTDKVKEKILELLWNTAAVDGGGTTLITRNGVISFIEGQLSLSENNKVSLKRLAARLYESSAKVHVKEWSKGNIASHLIGGIFIK